jgi:hypothetical protein
MRLNAFPGTIRQEPLSRDSEAIPRYIELDIPVPLFGLLSTQMQVGLIAAKLVDGA